MKTEPTASKSQQEMFGENPTLKLRKAIGEEGYEVILGDNKFHHDLRVAAGSTKHQACSNARTFLQAQADRANELCGLSERLLEAEVTQQDAA